jgi:hypothetical protein
VLTPESLTLPIGHDVIVGGGGLRGVAIMRYHISRRQRGQRACRSDLSLSGVGIVPPLWAQPRGIGMEVTLRGFANLMWFLQFYSKLSIIPSKERNNSPETYR